jgi:hypothetical protein
VEFEVVRPNCHNLEFVSESIFTSASLSCSAIIFLTFVCIDTTCFASVSGVESPISARTDRNSRAMIHLAGLR